MSIVYIVYYQPKKFFGRNRILLGNKYDGYYFLFNDFTNIIISNNFGFSGNIQFDKAFADKDIDVIMYDHTINYLQYANPKFH